MGQVRNGNLEDRVLEGREAVENFASRAKQEGDRILSSASEKVTDLTSQLSDCAADAKCRVSDQMSNLAGTIREKAPSTGKIATAASAVADGLENSGKYLNKDFTEMAEDVTSLVKRYPMQAICAGIGVGFLVGTYFKSARR